MVGHPEYNEGSVFSVRDGFAFDEKTTKPDSSPPQQLGGSE